MRHLIVGLDCAIAGAATAVVARPAPAVCRNWRRFICSSLGSEAGDRGCSMRPLRQPRQSRGGNPVGKLSLAKTGRRIDGRRPAKAKEADPEVFAKICKNATAWGQLVLGPDAYPCFTGLVFLNG